ncbi:type II 3-dehydroquinate dehydratase [Bacillus marinisedimentorum]|uniref:type II 3-dehydroquinate dehydratase n=1 Tax=Bacillus marinisedimentorum TaxID=1821260 RepID=UPI000871ED48|nr:type II 3-dehydroquinate dehydratase [Bacillus marinisedimentorum]
MPNRTYYVLNGPNLNLLGKREPGIYGSGTLRDLEKMLEEHAEREGYGLVFKQSNHEGDLIDWIHEAGEKSGGAVFNPGAFTHYSYALRDAVASVPVPVIEVHLSNIHAREEFRSRSVIAPEAAGQIAGLGFLGYRLALEGLIERTEGSLNHEET